MMTLRPAFTLIPMPTPKGDLGELYAAAAATLEATRLTECDRGEPEKGLLTLEERLPSRRIVCQGPCSTCDAIHALREAIEEWLEDPPPPRKLSPHAPLSPAVVCACRMCEGIRVWGFGGPPVL